jgi:saccharopine dehydrogenase-like NADP-dependent oxidoreductase
MHHILLFGAGKSATCLIDYLLKESFENDWLVIVADGDLLLAQSKTRNHPRSNVIQLNVENKEQRWGAIQKADIVISLLPPPLHYLVALDCIASQKNLLTASYIDSKIGDLKKAIEQKGLFFLCEMGLDPGIDHMSAMQLIDRIKEEGSTITSFKSHCGGLIAPESDTNPWHYKISWNPRNVVLAGNTGAVYKQAGKIINKSYAHLFEDCPRITVGELPALAYYPNRDSLSYIPIYGLDTADTFIRTTLRYPDFCNAWNAVIAAGLTSDTQPIPIGISFKKWSEAILPFVNAKNEKALQFLGLFDEVPMAADLHKSTDVLQYLLENRLMMEDTDKDMIVMLHELEYRNNDTLYSLQSSLIVKGENNTRTAMAKTVGLPLGIAAKLILQKKIGLTGLHIPILPAIYEPVLLELVNNQIQFTEKEKKHDTSKS